MSAAAAAAHDRRPAPLPDWLQRVKWTAIPDAYSDNIEPYLRPAERSLMKLLFQRTVGNPSYGKKERPQHVDLSQSEIAAAIGVKHKNTISRATKLLVELGLAKVVAVGRRYRYVLGQENAEAMHKLKPETVIRTVRRYVAEEAAAKERREAAKAAQEIVEEAPGTESKRLVDEEARPALRIVGATEPLVMMPGEKRLRPLSEVCAQCSLTKRRTNDEVPFGASEETFVDSNDVTGVNVSPDCDNRSPFLRSLSEDLKAALAEVIPPVPFGNWIAPAAFKLNGSAERPVLTVQAQPAEVDWIRAEYPEIIRTELAKLGVPAADIRFEVRESPPPASAAAPRPSLPTEDVAHAYLRAVRALIDQHKVEERVGQVLDLKFVADQVARVCVPIAHIERAFSEKARKFTRPGFLVNLIDDAISYNRHALRQTVLAGSERAYERA